MKIVLVMVILNILLFVVVRTPSEYTLDVQHNEDVVTLKVSGTITKTLADKVISSVRDYDQVVLFIDSDGGLLSQGIRMGDVLAEKNTKIIVEKACQSACVNVLFSGNEVVVGEFATIAIHRPAYTSGGDLSDKDAAYFISEKYKLYSKKLSHEDATWLIKKTFETPNEKVYILSKKELTRLGVTIGGVR